MYKQFAYIYDDILQQHESPYDPKHETQERPERAVLIHKRLQDEGLLKGAKKIELRRAEDWEICLAHPQDLIDELTGLKTVDELEQYCKEHELLWLCPKSVEIARLTVGGVIDLIKANVANEIGNGFAITRPPGHHSWGRSPQGFCVFNNVAIGAKYAVEKLGLNKILIIDVDYHCGNGNYHSFKNDNRFLYVNFHAYHHGAFWPYKEEYDYDSQYKNIISIPLNASLNSEGDYIGALQHLVIPIAEEFQPDLVLVSLGFDSAYYDDLLENGQGIKAPGYGHIMKLLHNHWPNKVLAILEGGYFWFSYTEAAAMATRGLRGLPLPKIVYPKRINACMAETIWNCLCHHSKYWKAAAKHLNELQNMQMRNGLSKYFLPTTKTFLGAEFRKIWMEVQKLKIARTRDWVPGMSPESQQIAKKKILEYIKEYDYNNPTKELSEDEFLEQLLWNSDRAGEAYLRSIPPTLWFYNGFKACLDSEDGKYIIIDMYAYRRAIKNQAAAN
uniref:Hist_deacetyl domain-containing protein n=1 Tax=Syphacia muris TaxID=451379 RepID=A0A0N5AS48_9BILA